MDVGCLGFFCFVLELFFRGEFFFLNCQLTVIMFMLSAYDRVQYSK